MPELRVVLLFDSDVEFMLLWRDGLHLELMQDGFWLLLGRYGRLRDGARGCGHADSGVVIAVAEHFGCILVFGILLCGVTFNLEYDAILVLAEMFLLLLDQLLLARQLEMIGVERVCLLLVCSYHVST